MVSERWALLLQCGLLNITRGWIAWRFVCYRSYQVNLCETRRRVSLKSLYRLITGICRMDLPCLPSAGQPFKHYPNVLGCGLSCLSAFSLKHLVRLLTCILSPPRPTSRSATVDLYSLRMSGSLGAVAVVSAAHICIPPQARFELGGY